MDRAESWMQIASTFAALLDADGRAIPAQVSRHNIDHVIVGCDLGNSAIKLALRQANAPQLRLFRFESIYTPAAMICAGDDTTALRVFRNRVWSEWFWIDQGDTIGGEALPIGATAERLADPRTVDFLVGALVAALENSGRLPGDHTLWVGFGVPNEEVSRAGLAAETRQALQQVRGQHVAAERRDATGAVTAWTLRIAELVPAPQSLGSFFAWYHTLAGQPAINDVDLVTVADLGGGHLSRFDVEIIRRLGQPPRFRGTGDILGAGMVVIARELIALINARYRVRLSETVALRALMTRTVLISGRRIPIDDLIETATQTRGQSLFAALHPILADHRRFLIVTGGGAACLHAELDARVTTAQRAPGTYLIVSAGVTSTLNAVGLFALALYTVQRES